MKEYYYLHEFVEGIFDEDGTIESVEFTLRFERKQVTGCKDEYGLPELYYEIDREEMGIEWERDVYTEKENAIIEAFVKENKTYLIEKPI